MTGIVLVTSSPFPGSRLGTVTRVLRRELARSGGDVATIALRDLPHSALLTGNHRHPRILHTRRLLRAGHAVMLVTPAYEVSGSPLLRAWLSLLPHDAFAGKIAQVVGLGAMRSQSIGLRSALIGHVPRTVLPACFVYEQWLEARAGAWRATDPAAERLTGTAADLCSAAGHTLAYSAAS